MRERRRTRAPGRIVKRDYGLRLCCAGYGRYLYGDIGRYRHPSPMCAAFLAATPYALRRYREPDDKRVSGHSYPRAGYERMFYALTLDAIDLGLNAALPAVLEIGKERDFGQGERISAVMSDAFQTVRFVRRESSVWTERSA